MDGVFVVDKPLGPTSHDVVTEVRRLIAIRRIGHTGTLDPLATGVLPLVVGRATRLAPLFSDTVKEYVADVRFGISTVTYDADPKVLKGQRPPAEPPGLSRARIEDAVLHFLGTGMQVPPAFSAKKIAGVPAYKRARRNEPVTLPPVSVTVHSITLEHYVGGLARIRLSCSAGFYVRTFAHELGRLVGCGAHLEALRRTRAGDFTLGEAVGLDELKRAGTASVRHLIPMERLLLNLPGVVLNDRGAERASHGSTLAATDICSSGVGAEGQLRLLGPSGALLGIAEARANGLLHPVIVLV
jgi:tRNA pseudouridine55 synthase